MRSEVDLRPLAEQLGIRPQFLAQLPESELAPFLASVGRALQFVQHTDRGGDAARFKEVQALLEDLSCRDASADQIFYRIGQATPIQRQMELVNEERLSRIGSLNYRSGCWMNWIRGLISDPHSACVQDLRGLSISLLTDISIPAQMALQLRTDPELKTLLEAGMSKSETRTPSGELMDITIKIERKIDVDGIGTIHLTQIGETFELSNTAILGVRSLEGRRQPLSERYYIKSGQKVPQALRKAILKEQGKPEWQRPQPPEISQLRSCLGHGAGHENLDLVVARPDPDRGIALEVLGEVVSITRFGRPLSDDPRASDRRFFTAVSALSGPDLTLEKIQPAVIRLLQVAEKEDLETLDNLILKVGADSELWTSVCRDKSVRSVLESAVVAALHTPNCDTSAMEIAMKRFEINYAQAFPDACKDGLRHQLSQFEIQIESELLCFCRRVKQYCPDIITAPEVKGALTTFATATSQISGGRARAEDVWSALGLESSELDLIAAEAFKELKPPGVLDQAAILLGNVRNKELFIQDPEVEDKAIELILELCMQPHKRVKPEDLLRDSGLAPAALAVKLPLLLRLPEGEARRADFFAFFASRISRILEQSAEKPPWNMRNADGLLRLFEAHLKGGLLATQVRTWASQLGIEETLGDQAHDWLSGEIIFAKKSNKLSFFGQQVLKAFPNLKEDKDFRPDLIKLGEINEEA